MSGDTTNTTSIIDEILQAPTHYAVLGLDHNQNDNNDNNNNIDNAMLRKAYLRRSVKVHPDKNSDPRATTAFQKVAQAWQVLSDDTRRAAYNAALRQGRADPHADYNNDNDNNGTQQQTYYAGPPPNMQESLFVFATVVGSMMGGKTVGNLSQALFWAEKFLQQQGDKSRNGNAEMSNGEKATLAMALGSSLKVASSAAKSLGMSGTSRQLENTARMAQMAGVGIMVAEQPAVQRVLQSDSLRKLKGGIHAVRAALQQQQQQQQQQASNDGTNTTSGSDNNNNNANPGGGGWKPF